MNLFNKTYKKIMEDIIGEEKKDDKKGKCDGSCIVKDKNDSTKWRIKSGKDNSLWKQKYDSRDTAKKALSVYFVNKNK